MSDRIPSDEMWEKVFELTAAANIVQDKELRKARRSALLDRLLFLAVIVILLWVGVLNRTTLSEVKSQTSPEAQQARNEAVNQIVLTIDCNQRIVVQNVLDRLEAQGVLERGQASIVGEPCKD